MARTETREALELCARRLVMNLCPNASGNDVLRVMYEELGGMRITVPTIRELEIEARDRRVRLKFRGDNHKQLAEQFGLSVRQVRRIVNRV